MQRKQTEKKRTEKKNSNGFRTTKLGSDQLRVENQRLLEQLQDQKKMRLRDLKTIKKLQMENDDFERAIYASCEKHAKQDDWKNFKKEDYLLTAEEVLNGR